MKRVLVITYYWPPSGGSGVQRWVKFTKYLPESGWQPVIYTPENPEMPGTDTTLLADIPPQTEVIKTHISEIYGIYNRFSGGGARRQVNPINHQRKNWKQRLAMWVRGNFFIPDPRRGWVRPSVRFLTRYLAEHPVDAIVSTGPPHSMHLIARGVAKATGIPWVADFRDPWTKLFYFKHLQLSPWTVRQHRRLEKQVLDDASVVVAVSPLVQDEFRAMTDTPVELVTNGFDADDFTAAVPRPDRFTLVHTGLFAADGNPEVLWKVLKDKVRSDAAFAARLRIVLAGKTDAAVRHAIEDAGLSYEDLGYRSHTETVRLQKGASLLLLPLRKEPEYRATLPGKLFEYLGARRPVLGIGQTDGAMARVLQETAAGQTVAWEDEAATRRAIDQAWEAYRTGTDHDTQGDIDRFERRATARQMAAILDRL